MSLASSLSDGAVRVAKAPASARRATSPEPATTAAATWIIVVGGNDTYWRCEAPAAAVGGKVAAIEEKHGNERLTQPTLDGAFPWGLVATTTDGLDVPLWSADEWSEFTAMTRAVTGMRAEFPELEGPAVWVRPDIPRAVLAKAMRQQGIRTIAEADDNYFCKTGQNLFLRQQRADEGTREQHAKSMASMDANVFSTPWLRDRYYREYRQRFGKQGLPEMHVCRNGLPLTDWPERVEHDGVRVGFMGSPSHVWDVNLAYAAFHAAKQAGAETWMVGYNPADPNPGVPDEVESADGVVYEIRSAKAREFIAKWEKVVDRHVGWVTPAAYHRAAIPFDIGLAPLLTNDFTLGKSDVKAVEYAISGAACVLQNHTVYSTAGWVNGVNCLMAGSWREMGEQTLRLIRDPKLRYELVTAAQELVATERNGDVLKREWEAALAS